MVLLLLAICVWQNQTGQTGSLLFTVWQLKLFFKIWNFNIIVLTLGDHILVILDSSELCALLMAHVAVELLVLVLVRPSDLQFDSSECSYF